ncbi:MAG: GNAT family N-acetyltransferase [Oscillospiraceae bacterium]|nr:GNAT family N-acetyltransferase [Oscillospiraceae bacterium]
MVREARREDLQQILELYLFLHERDIPEQDRRLDRVWRQIIDDEDHHLIVNVIDDRIVSSCVCVIVPNLTRGVRPYAVVENVVTRPEYRGRGYASECLEYAKSVAEGGGCYKMMLLTGSKDQKTLRFYQKAGYNSTDKTAFIQWLGRQ